MKPIRTVCDIDEMKRFWSKVRLTDTCWNWIGGKHDGKGRFLLATGKVVHAHLAAYDIVIGSVPEGVHLEHTCGDIGCVNPGHLRQVRNTRDVRKQTGFKIKVGKL